MRRIAALISALVMLVGVLVTGAGSPAGASYQVKQNVGIRMYDVNRVITGCANYPVEYVVGNYPVGTSWTVELYLTKRGEFGELASIKFTGIGPESGRKQFRLCSNRIAGGVYIAHAWVGECEPGPTFNPVAVTGPTPDPEPLDCPNRPEPLLNEGAPPDLEDPNSPFPSITTLFKRTSSVRLWMSPRDPARGAPVTLRGNLRLEGVDGKLHFVGGRLVKLYGQKGPDSPFTYIATVRTDPTGEYRLALSHRRSSGYLAIYQGSPAYFRNSYFTGEIWGSV